MSNLEGPDGRTRRELLRDAGTVSVVVMAGSLLGSPAVAFAVDATQRAFLNEEEMRTLRALVDVFIPEDEDPGAAAAGCAEAIDALLGAFTFDPPRIFAGAPFSDRAGSPVNNFENFLRLDAYEEKGWRLRIEGSRGKPELERNGPVDGWQVTYRNGLKALADQGFADAPAPQQQLILRSGSDPSIAALVEIAWPHTWEFMYGAPEYGGNKDLVGWKYAVYQGDVHPRGWTREEVESGPIEEGVVSLSSAPLPLADLLALAAFGGSPELAHNLMVRSGGNVEALRKDVLPAIEYVRKARDGR